MNSCKDWWKRTIAYEIYPSSFQDSNGDGFGDINGIIRRLDHLQSLSVGALWLTPVYASPMVDNGYDVSDFYNINPLYGTMDDMDNLIAEAAKRKYQNRNGPGIQPHFGSMPMVPGIQKEPKQPKERLVYMA